VLRPIAGASLGVPSQERSLFSADFLSSGTTEPIAATGNSSLPYEQHEQIVIKVLLGILIQPSLKVFDRNSLDLDVSESLVL
jgi:hypothetical protein